MSRSSSLLFALAATVVCAGSAHAGALTPMPISLKFPDTGTGSTSNTQSVTYTNTGMNSATLDTAVIAGTNPNDFVIVNPPPLPIALAPGASLSFDVAFSPTVGGPRAGKLAVQVRNEGNTTDVTLTGTGVGPKITVTPAPLEVGGVLFGAQVPPLAAKVSNAGGAKVTVSAITIKGPDAGLFSLSNMPSLPLALTANQAASFSLNFAPAQAGTASATLVVTSDDPMTPSLETAIIGRSGNPQVTLDFATIIFGNQRVGIASVPQDINVSNTGLSDLHISAMSVTGANAGDFPWVLKPMTPLVLKVGQSTKLTVGFTPAAAGARTANVQINSDDPKFPMKLVPVSGTGTTPMAAVMPPMIAFGPVKVAGSASQSISIINKGTGPVKVTTLNVTGANAADFTLSLGAPFTVAPMSTSVVQVTFKPKSVIAETATVNVATDDPNLPMFQVPLSGSGTSPKFVLDPMSIDFGGLPVGIPSAMMPFTITNNGNQAMSINLFQLAGAGAKQFTVTPPLKTPQSLAVGGTLTFQVSYKPVDGSSDDARVNIAVDDPATPSGTVTLHGFGQQPTLDVTPMDADTIDFGSITVGNTMVKKVQIQNLGDAPLNISGLKLGGMTTPFSLDQQAPLVIKSMGVQVVNVTFAPKMAAVSMAQLEIDSSDPNIQLPVTINLMGTGISPMINASPVNIDFGSTTVIGMTSAAQTVTIRNGSTKPQTLGMVTSDDPHFVVDLSTFQATVPGGGSTAVNVTFTPDSDLMAAGRIQVYLPGQTMPVATVLVSGTGLAVPVAPPSRGCAVGGGSPSSGAGGLLLAAAVLGLVARRRRRNG